MSEYKPTYDTPCHNFPHNLEIMREEIENSALGMMGVAMDYINDLENALSVADNYSLDLRDEISKMNDNVYRGLVDELVDSLKESFCPRCIDQCGGREDGSFDCNVCNQRQELITKAKESLP